MLNTNCSKAILPILSILLVSSSLQGQIPELKLATGDHVAYIGNTMADRMQHSGWLETFIHATHP